MNIVYLDCIWISSNWWPLQEDQCSHCKSKSSIHHQNKDNENISKILYLLSRNFPNFLGNSALFNKYFMHCGYFKLRYCLATLLVGALTLSLLKGSILFYWLVYHWLKWPEMNDLRHSARLQTHILTSSPQCTSFFVRLGEWSEEVIRKHKKQET